MKVYNIVRLMFTLSVTIVAMLLVSCGKKAVEISPEDCIYIYVDDESDNQYIMYDSLQAGSDGVTLSSGTGTSLTHSFNATAGVNITFPVGFTVGEVGIGYSLSIAEITINAQTVNGLKKGQLVEFYYSKTSAIFDVYTKRDNKLVGSLSQPYQTLSYGFKVYDTKPSLVLVKDLGEPWLPNALVPQSDHNNQSLNSGDEIFIMNPKSDKLFLGFDIPAYQASEKFWSWLPYEVKQTVMIGGKSYTNGLVFLGHSASPYAGTIAASFNLEGKYSKIQGVYGHIDGSADIAETFTIYGDDSFVAEITMSPSDLGIPFELDVTNINVLKITVPLSAYSSDTYYGFAEAELITQ